MKTRPFGLAVLLLIVASVPAIAQPPADANPEVIDRFKAHQQRAQDLTTDLLSLLVDTQIQQLEDNQLTDMLLYQDLVAMRGSLGALAKQKMPEVIDLLMEADVAQPAVRKELMVSVHGKMKEVLFSLLREREKLRLRRQHAELIERITEVVSKQKVTRDGTLKLSPTNEQELLATGRSQEEVSLLVESFSNTLQIVSDWSGELGNMATQCAKIISDEQVPELLNLAETQLAKMDFAVAAGTQKQIIESLEQILLKIRRFEDPAWIDADAKNAAKDILDKQEKLKEKVEAGELEKEENVESLVEEQSMVREQLERLKSSLANNEAAMELAERAAEAASEAREAIFESESAEAIELQEEVIGSLAELTNELENDPAAQTPELSSEEFQKLAEALAETQEKLDQALELNEQATVQAAESKPEAAKTEQEAESKVAEASNPDTLPESVNQAIEEAKQEVAEAKESLMNDSENQDAAMAQLDEADQAIREAIGETEVALEEAMKNALAAKIGELNRAVEALERSASKSRETAAELNEQGAPSKEQVEQAKEDFNKIASIAQDVAEGIKPLSQESVDGLEQAAEQAQDLANSIPKSAGNEPAENEAADQANAVADMLENAADELRKEMTATAEDLVNEIKGQLNETTELKNEVAMANNPEQPSDSNALENLADQALQELPNVGKALQEAAEAAAQSEEGNEPAGEPSGEQSGEPSGEGTPQPPTGDKPKPGQANPSPDSEPGSAGDMGESAESEGSPPVDPETQKNRQMLRAEVLADIDEERLEEELAAAEALKALTEQGRQSAEQIAQSREAMATEPGSPQGENSAEQVASSESPAGTPSESSGSPSESPQGTPPGEGNAPPSGQGESGQPAESLAGEAPLSPAQQELQEAVFDQAEALAGIGALAEALTEQSGIANEPIREAAQLASTLEPMEAEPLAATPAEGAEGAAGDAGEAPMTAALPATGSPLLDPGGFVPNAPLQTAQMMAGQNVPLPSESQMAESGMPMGSDSSGLPSDSPMPGSESGQPGSQPGQPSPMATFANAAATGGGTSKGKQGLSENQAPKEGVPQVVEAQTDADSRVPGGRNGDAKTQQQPVEKSPFFTSLPKSVREAINSRGNRKLPRGYEERLKKYFKNIK